MKRLATANITKMRPGQELAVKCETVAELNSAQQVAYYARRALKGAKLRIRRDSYEMTLYVTCLAEGEETPGRGYGI